MLKAVNMVRPYLPLHLSHPPIDIRLPPPINLGLRQIYLDRGGSDPLALLDLVLELPKLRQCDRLNVV